MRARPIARGRRNRRGQAAGAALVVLLALAVTWILAERAHVDNDSAGVRVDYIEATAPPGPWLAGAPDTRGRAATAPGSGPGGSLASGQPVTASAVALAPPDLLAPGELQSAADGPGSPGEPVRPGAGGGPLVPGLASLLTAPDTGAVELGLAEGDFLYRRGLGWCRYEPSAGSTPGRFLPVNASALPEELRLRYPANRFPPTGVRVPESGCSSSAPALSETAPWNLESAR